MHEDRPRDERSGEHRREGGAQPEPRRERSLATRLIVGLVLLVLFLLFISANSQEVEVSFLVSDFRVPLVWIFLLCALIGAAVAFLLGRSGRRSSKKYIRELERRLGEHD